MRTRSTILSSIIAVAIVSSAGRIGRCDGPNADVSALFAQVAAAYRNFKSVSFEMKVVAGGRFANKLQTVTTRLSLVKPDRLSAELTDKEGVIRVVADGKSIITSSSRDSAKYLKLKDTGYRAIIQSLTSAGGTGTGLVSVLLSDPRAETKIVQGTAVFVRRAADAVVGGEKCDIVNAQTVNGKMTVGYKFAFAKSDHFLRSLTISDAAKPGTPIFTETYSSVKINQPVNPALFRYTPPKGAVAIDPTAPPLPYNARIKIGAPPIPITGVDLAGKPVSFSQYKGQVVLVDFWATWCGPCINELPTVVAAYGRYHSQGFDVVGITLDKGNAKQQVQSFVTSHKMPWRQIYDGKYWSSANAQAYEIHAIPFSLLIGRDGKVAAIGPRGPDLAPAIEAALKRR